MPKASVKRLIKKSKDTLIKFVLDIEKYPEFIPFCESSKVYDIRDDGKVINIIADLTIGMTKSFQYGLEKIADAFQKRAETL